MIPGLASPGLLLFHDGLADLYGPASVSRSKLPGSDPCVLGMSIMTYQPSFTAFRLGCAIATVGVLTAGPSMLPLPALAAEDELLVVVDDKFESRSSSGWASAPVGGPYVHVGSESYSESGGYGTVTLSEGGQHRVAGLPSASMLDGIARINIAMGDIPAQGGGVYHSLHLRQGESTSYRATLRVTPAGEGHLYLARVDEDGHLEDLGHFALPEPVRPHRWLTMEFSATGTSPVALAAKAYTSGEPASAWQLTASDSSYDRLRRAGSVSLQTYASRSGPGTTAFYDSLHVQRSLPGLPPAPKPIPVPPTPPRPEPPAPEPVPPSPGGLGSSGALPLGDASYPVPANAVFVSPQGSDDDAGTRSEPLRTVDAALDQAGAGGTVVLRAGSYHQRFTVNQPVTIQNYPGEAVWLDGSTPIEGFTQDAHTWRHDDWTASFDASQSFTRGDNSRGFVDPEHPMAAHPDQVWINGVAQRQVASKQAVTSGTFYVDYARDRLYLGSDPVNKNVRASDIGRAIEVRAGGTTLRGFGVRRYAPSLPDMGTVTIERPGASLENLHLVDNATTGVSLLATNIDASRLTLLRNGLLGIHGNHADDLTLTHIASSSNNTERFNHAPVSGGIKISRSRGIDVDRVTLADNIGPGFWLDESVYDGSITNSLIHDNAGHGMSLEISALMLVSGNVIRDNGRFGIKINNTSDVSLWNNTIVRNDRPINAVQDTRRGDDPSAPGHDPRRPVPDPTMPWINGPITIRNNVLSAETGNCILCVEDYSYEFSAEDMDVSANSNVYHKQTENSPQYLTIWSRGSASPATYTTLTQFKSGTGQEVKGHQLVGDSAADNVGRTTEVVRQLAPSVATPLPESIATRLDLPTGTRVLGAPYE